MKSSIVERLARMNRLVGMGIVAGISVLLVAAGIFLTRGDDTSGDAPPEWMEGVPGEPLLGPDGLPVVSNETLIAESVAATIEALPTETPMPTRDVGATLEAELAMNRQHVQPIIQMNPLDSNEGIRSPFLTPEELDYFRDFGPRLWIYTKVWFHLQRMISEDIGEWTAADIHHDLGESQVLIDTAPDRPRFPRDDSVGPIVRAYADSLESGFSGVRSAVARLADAEAILASGSLGNAEREELIQVVRDMEEHLGEFDKIMSSYGCSVCGELLRMDGS